MREHSGASVFQDHYKLSAPIVSREDHWVKLARFKCVKISVISNSVEFESKRGRERLMVLVVAIKDSPMIDIVCTLRDSIGVPIRVPCIKDDMPDRVLALKQRRVKRTDVASGTAKDHRVDGDGVGCLRAEAAESIKTFLSRSAEDQLVGESKRLVVEGGEGFH